MKAMATLQLLEAATILAPDDSLHADEMDSFCLPPARRGMPAPVRPTQKAREFRGCPLHCPSSSRPRPSVPHSVRVRRHMVSSPSESVLPPPSPRPSIWESLVVEMLWAGRASIASREEEPLHCSASFVAWGIMIDRRRRRRRRRRVIICNASICSGCAPSPTRDPPHRGPGMPRPPSAPQPSLPPRCSHRDRRRGRRHVIWNVSSLTDPPAPVVRPPVPRRRVYVHIIINAHAATATRRGPDERRPTDRPRQCLLMSSVFPSPPLPPPPPPLPRRRREIEMHFSWRR